MQKAKLFSHRQAARFYDMLGVGLDTQTFYETAALHDLVVHLKLATGRSVVEFGCGTGRLAAELLSVHLPNDATYFGLDVSNTMVRLAKGRLCPFAGRAEVRQSDGTPYIDTPDATFDRFISTYVLDLLSDEEFADGGRAVFACRSSLLGQLGMGSSSILERTTNRSP